MNEKKKKSKKYEIINNNKNHKIESKLFYKKINDFKKRNILIISLISIVLSGIFIFVVLNDRSKSFDDNTNYVEEVPKYSVKIHLDFTENLIFSKYDILFSIDDNSEILTHGEDGDFEFLLEVGNYNLIFENLDDSSINKTINLSVTNDMEVGYKISCHYDSISITNLYTDIDKEIGLDEIKMKVDKSEFIYDNYKSVIKKLNEIGFANVIEKPMYDIVLGWTEVGEVANVTINGVDTYKRGDIFKKDVEVIVSYHLKEEDNPLKENNDKSKVEEEQKNGDIMDEVKYNFYTTNDNKVAKKGNSGKYSYIKRHSTYDVYWIIDFDNGYVYDFSDGNGDDSVEKIKIKSGNLNDGLELLYKNSDNAWVKYMHFKYVEQPHQLIIVDNDYFKYEFSTTSLKDALNLLENKIIFEP